MGYYYDNTEHWQLTIVQDNLDIWEKKSYMTEETPDDRTDFIIRVVVAGTTASDQNQSCFADNVILIDLTETFGAGNEPDQAWCDANIDWFEGSKVIYKY